MHDHEDEGGDDEENDGIRDTDLPQSRVLTLRLRGEDYIGNADTVTGEDQECHQCATQFVEEVEGLVEDHEIH